MVLIPLPTTTLVSPNTSLTIRVQADLREAQPTYQFEVFLDNNRGQQIRIYSTIIRNLYPTYLPPSLYGMTMVQQEEEGEGMK